MDFLRNFLLAPQRGSCRTLFLLLAVTAALAWNVTAQAQAKRPSEQTQPRGSQPLDPLTAEEKKGAQRVALADARVKELLDSKPYRLVYVEFLAGKGEAATGAEGTGGAREVIRQAEVVFSVSGGDFGVRAVVDLKRQAVVEASRLDPDSVPLTPDDLAEALRIALANEQVRSGLGANADRYQVEGKGPTGRFIVRGLRVQTTDEKDPCWKHRCLQLLFREGDAYLSEPVVIVDLNTKQVQLGKAQQEHEQRSPE